VGSRSFEEQGRKQKSGKPRFAGFQNGIRKR